MSPHDTCIFHVEKIIDGTNKTNSDVSISLWAFIYYEASRSETECVTYGRLSDSVYYIVLFNHETHLFSIDLFSNGLE